MPVAGRGRLRRLELVLLVVAAGAGPSFLPLLVPLSTAALVTTGS